MRKALLDDKLQINVGQVGNLRTDWQSVPASHARLQ